MVHWVSTELLPIDEICTGHFWLTLCNKEQYLGKEGVLIIFCDSSSIFNTGNIYELAHLYMLKQFFKEVLNICQPQILAVCLC